MTPENIQETNIHETNVPRPKWALVTVAALIAAMLTLFGWYAGRLSRGLEHQHLITKVTQSQDELSSSRFQARRDQQQADNMRAALAASGHAELVDQITSLQNQLRQAEVHSAQYKALLQRSQQELDERQDVFLMLGSPQLKLIRLKAPQSRSSLGYGLVVPHSKLAFIGSNLKDLPNGREYQLWIVKKTGSSPTSAGVFTPDENGHAYVQIEDGELVADPVAIVVTEEPAGGSRGPTGARCLISVDSL